MCAVVSYFVVAPVSLTGYGQDGTCTSCSLYGLLVSCTYIPNAWWSDLRVRELPVMFRTDYNSMTFLV